MGLEHILMYILGIACGVLVAYFVNQSHTGSGTLKIDHSNPEKDVYRFEIDDLEKLNGKDEIVLKIDHNADLSQD